MAEILVDDRWIGAHGIGRFAREVISRLGPCRPLGVKGRPTDPLDPLRVARALRGRAEGVYFNPGFNPPWQSDIPFVFTIHDLIHLHFPAESSLLNGAYYELLVRRGAERAAAVFTVSQFSRREILAWLGLPGEKVIVVGDGVSAAFRPGGPKHAPARPYVLHVGNFKPHKNVPALIEAFARCRIDPAIQLVLTGQGEARLAALADSLGVAGRVVFAGSPSDEDLAAFYRGALALVIPSLYEGFGLPAVEAMACGTPVLASNATALPETVGQAALLVDARDAEALARGIETICADAPLRARLVAAGLARAAGFTWDAVADRVKDVLQGAATGKPG